MGDLNAMREEWISEHVAMRPHTHWRHMTWRHNSQRDWAGANTDDDAEEEEDDDDAAASPLPLSLVGSFPPTAAAAPTIFYSLERDRLQSLAQQLEAQTRSIQEYRRRQQQIM